MGLHSLQVLLAMGSAVRVRSAGQNYGPTCHQRDRADVTEFVTLVRLSSLGQHVGVLALAGYKRRNSALTAGPILCPAVKVSPFPLLKNVHLSLTSCVGSTMIFFSFLSFHPNCFFNSSSCSRMLEQTHPGGLAYCGRMPGSLLTLSFSMWHYATLCNVHVLYY